MRNQILNWINIFVNLSLWISLFGFSACSKSSSEPVVTSLKRSSPLGTLNEMRGIYGPACIDRTGEWSVQVQKGCPASPASPPPLSVVQGDTTCTLQIESVLLDCVPYEAAQLDIDTEYHTYGTPFYPEGDCNVAFYANTLLSSPDFGNNFLIKFIYSQGLAESSAAAITTYDKVVTLFAATHVKAPDYTADPTPLDLQVDILNNVTQVNGFITLLPGIQSGESFLVVNALSNLQKNYAFVDNLFQSSSPMPITLSLDASLFQLLNQNLPPSPPLQRDIIISHTDPNSHIASYEIITISFFPASTF